LLGAGLDEIKISFDGASPGEYERIRVPLKFDRVVANIEGLVTLRNELRSPMKIHVACCSTSDRQGTIRMLEGLVDGFAFGKIHNWAASGLANGHARVRKPCSRLWRTLTVLAGGDVALWCLDYDGQHLLGRVDERTSLREIWHSAAYRDVRGRHKQSRQAEIALCRHCSKSFW
jgi:MoaA/NifB/PqqE/SkfB family radical SAM enzyme